MKNKLKYFIGMKVFLLVLLLLITLVNFVSSDPIHQPADPDKLPIEYAYLAQSLTCTESSIDSWVCPPCQAIGVRELLSITSVGPITMYIFYNSAVDYIEIGFLVSQSQSSKYQIICHPIQDNYVYTYSSANSTCLSNVPLIITNRMNLLLLAGDQSSPTPTITNSLDTFYSKIQESLQGRSPNRIIFFGYEFGGAIAQIVNSYFMIKTYDFYSFLSKSGCRPLYFTTLYQLNSVPFVMNNLREYIDSAFETSPWFSNTIINNYWFLFNLVNYKDPLSTLATDQRSDVFTTIQTVYYLDYLYYGKCDALDYCQLQSPPLTNTADFILNNHYYIMSIPMTPQTFSPYETCVLYEEQLYDFVASSTNYFSRLCDTLDQGSKTQDCISNVCGYNPDLNACSCNSQCVYYNDYPERDAPTQYGECCFDFCSGCYSGTTPTLECPNRGSGPVPPPSNIGTCAYPIILDNSISSIHTLDIAISTNEYGSLKYTCTPLKLLPSSNVVWLKFTPIEDDDYKFSVSDSSTVDTNMSIWSFSEDNICVTTGSNECSISKTKRRNSNQPEIIYPMTAGRDYYILVGTDLANAVGSFTLLYGLNTPVLIDYIELDNRKFLSEEEEQEYNFILGNNNFERLPGSCVGRCGELKTPIGACSCTSNCNKGVDENCCEDICDQCKIEYDDGYNIFCDKNSKGLYAFDCVGRCNEEILSDGCGCNPNAKAVNSINVQCLSYETDCPNIQTNAIDYNLCQVEGDATTRCGKDIGTNSEGLPDANACSCDLNGGTSNSQCSDAGTVCGNPSMLPPIKPTTTCFQKGEDYCGMSSVPDGSCSCSIDCMSENDPSQKKCCSDFCRCELVENCDVDGQLSIPPSPYDKTKFFKLSLSPQCSTNNYTNWRCNACSDYPGYDSYSRTFVIDGYNTFINYNSFIKETILNIESADYNSYYNLITSCLPYSTDTIKVSYNIDCDYVYNVTYLKKYYDVAMKIFLRLEPTLTTYFSTRSGSDFVIIGQGFGGAVAQIIYNEFVFNYNVARYQGVFNGDCSSKPLSRYHISRTDIVTIKGLVTNANNIIYNDGVTNRKNWEKLFPPSTYDGITEFNPNYLMFSYVNPFSIYSNFPLSLTRGNYGHNFQTYYLYPDGSLNGYLCNYYGQQCFSYTDKRAIISASIAGAIGYVVLGPSGFDVLPYINENTKADFVNYLQNIKDAISTYRVSVNIPKGLANLYNNINSVYKTGAITFGLITSENYSGLIAKTLNDLDFLFDTYEESKHFFEVYGEDICLSTTSRTINEEEIIEIYSNIIREYILRYNEHPLDTIKNSEYKYTINSEFKYELEQNIIGFNNSKHVINERDIVYTNSSFIDGKEEFSLYLSNFCSLSLVTFETLKVLSEVDSPITIEGKPTDKQFEKYHDILTIGWAPYNELQSYNCSMCNFYKQLGYNLYHWDHFTYYDIIWLVSSITKEVIILMSTDNDPLTINSQLCGANIYTQDFFIENLDNNTQRVCYPTSSNTFNQEFTLNYYTQQAYTMYPPQYFTAPYLYTDTTAQLMDDPIYADYQFTYLGFGTAVSKILNMFSWGMWNYNNGQGGTVVTTCPQNKTQAVIFAPVNDFFMSSNSFNTTIPNFVDRVFTFMNPCDDLPVQSGLTGLNGRRTNIYNWNAPPDGSKYLNSYYVNDTLNIKNYLELTPEERTCTIANNTHAYTVVPDHYIIGSTSSIYGYMRDAQQLQSNVTYETVYYQNITQACTLMQNYPTEPNSQPLIPVEIQQPPTTRQLQKYYKINLLSYSTYDQSLSKTYSWWNEDLQGYTIIEKLYQQNWVLSIYYSLKNNEVIVSMMARNDTELYASNLCNVNETVSELENINTRCTPPLTGTLYNNYNQDGKSNYKATITNIMGLYYYNKNSTITFTGIGLGGGFHKSLLLDLIIENSSLFNIPIGSCLQDYGNIDGIQSIFFSPTKNIMYNVLEQNVNFNITLPSFMTTIYINDDANYEAYYRISNITENVFTLSTTLSPLWVYYEGYPAPTLMDSTVEHLSSYAKFYNTYYNLPSPYYNQSNWLYTIQDVIYVNPFVSNPDIYNSTISNPPEACALLSINNIEIESPLDIPPTLIQSELYSYFSMLAYCPSSQLISGTCVNLEQNISPDIIESYEYLGSNEQYAPLRVIYYISHSRKNIIYAFALNSTDENLLNQGCTDIIWRNITYNVGLCSGSIGAIHYINNIFNQFSNWDLQTNFGVNVFKANRLSYPDYYNVFTGHALGGSFAHIAYIDYQIVHGMDRQTCVANELIRLITFGESPAAYITPSGSFNDIIELSYSLYMFNNCDPIPYMHDGNSNGYQYWPLAAVQGRTYRITQQYNIHLITENTIASNPGYSSCPQQNGYNIQFSNREYFHCTSYLGFYVNNNNSTITTTSIVNDDNSIREIIYEDWQKESGSQITLPEFCNSIIPNNVTATLDWRGPTRYQLIRYTKLMEISYAPLPLFPNTTSPFIPQSTIDSVFQDPQVNQYLNNNQSGQYVIGYHKIAYFINYQIKEFVISIVPMNNSEPYYYHSCCWDNYFCPRPTYASSMTDLFTNRGPTDIATYVGNVQSFANLVTVATKIRYIQQTIFEGGLLSGHGSKVDWTLTLIAKDTGNTAISTFIYTYYKFDLSTELIDGVNRYKLSGTGYKHIQSLGFGDVSDKALRNNPGFILCEGGNGRLEPPTNRIGKNIFQVVAQYEDKIGKIVSNYYNGEITCLSYNSLSGECCEGYVINKDHITRVYDQTGNRILDNNSYYSSGRYNWYVEPDQKTLSTMSYGNINSYKIKRDYFGIIYPGFEAYSRWISVSETIWNYNFAYGGTYINYDDPSYDICDASNLPPTPSVPH